MLLGTDRRSEEQLADTLQAMGGGLRASGDPDGVTLSGESLAPELGGLLEVLGEVLTGARYPRRGVERERVRLAEHGRLQLSQPPSAAADAWAARRYGDHPYGRRIPRPEEVLEVAPGSLRGAHGRRITPDGGVLVLVGDVVPARALDLVERHLGAWASTSRNDAVPRGARPGDRVRCCWSTAPARCRPMSASAGTRADMSDPSYAAVQVADAIFTGLFSSRLIANLREDKGYTYGSYSVMRHQRAGSSLAVGVDVATDVAAPALVETLYELGRMVTLPPEPAEVDAAVQYLTGTSMLAHGHPVRPRRHPAVPAGPRPRRDLAARPSGAARGRGRRSRSRPRRAHCWRPAVWSGRVLGDAERLHAALATVTEVTTLARA